MVVKIINQNISKISEHKYIRSDFKYRNEEKTFLKNKKYTFPLKNIFHFINGITCTEYYSTSKTEIPFIRIGNLSFKDEISDDDMIYLDSDFYSDSSKKLRKNDIILATIGNTVGKINVADSYEGGYFSNNTLVLRNKYPNTNVKFYEKLFQSDTYLNHIRKIASQKAQPNLQQYDIENMIVPVIDNKIQEDVIEKTKPIEQRIKQLKATIKPVQEVIDDVFTRELGFNKSEFVELKKKLQFKTTIADFGGNRDLRNSCKFHRPSAYMLQQFLNGKTNLKIKHFLTEDIVLGAGVSPSDYDENGDYSYISMATIKNWDVNYEEAKSVSNDYSNLKIAKSIKKGDILIARSGEGTIGKVALVEEDYDGIFADFVMRVRLEGCNLKFAYYYFRSYIFQYLIEIHKKGLGNNTNIFPVQIREFPFPTISLSDQERIVEEIQTEIDKQDKIRKEIEQERNRIDEIIESVILSDE